MVCYNFSLTCLQLLCDSEPERKSFENRRTLGSTSTVVPLGKRTPILPPHTKHYSNLRQRSLQRTTACINLTSSDLYISLRPYTCALAYFCACSTLAIRLPAYFCVLFAAFVFLSHCGSVALSPRHSLNSISQPLANGKAPRRLTTRPIAGNTLKTPFIKVLPSLPHLLKTRRKMKQHIKSKLIIAPNFERNVAERWQKRTTAPLVAPQDR